MKTQTVVERIKDLGAYEGTTDPAAVIRDIYSVASTLLHDHAWEYCACQVYPCECVMRFMDDLAECIGSRHPGSSLNKPKAPEPGPSGGV